MTPPKKKQINEAIERYSFRMPCDVNDTYYSEEAAIHFKAGIYWVLKFLKQVH